MEVPAETLVGEHIQLEPVEELHRQPMRQAGDDLRIWRNTPLGASFDDYFDGLLALRASGEQIPFAVRKRADEQLIGATRLMDIVRVHRRLEIGGTWYHPDQWGGLANPQAKLLLLTHAFERCGAHRVQLLTDVLNERSQAAIAKLGAEREGVARNHMIVDGGRRRDSVVFSITIEQWPQVRERLEKRLRALSQS